MCLFVAGGLFASAAAAAGANMALMTAVTTGISMTAQAQQASAQNAYMSQQQAAGEALARSNYENQLTQGFTRTLQEREAMADDIMRVTMEGRKAAALNALSAAERGITGQSVDAVYAEFEANELGYQMNAQRNLGYREKVIQGQLVQAQHGGSADIANLQFMPQQGPNLMAGLASIGSAAFGSWQNATLLGPSPTAQTSNLVSEGSLGVLPSWAQQYG
jgi:hypothetical protein